MALSSTSLIHYTNSFKNLKGILENKFKIKYCSEIIPTGNKKTIELAVPMVSFCDIPLSDAKNHIESYGSYGIGLYKDWAKNKKLNPIIYLEENSYLTDCFLKNSNLLASEYNNNKLNELNRDLLLNYFKILSYTKPYSMDLNLKSKKVIKDYKFYNEKEWRYVPINVDPQKSNILPKAIFEKNKSSYNERLKKLSLDFEIDDIAYLILKEKSEISKLISEINKIFSSSCTKSQIEILYTKIITIHQIQEDF